MASPAEAFGGLAQLAPAAPLTVDPGPLPLGEGGRRCRFSQCGHRNPRAPRTRKRSSRSRNGKGVGSQLGYGRSGAAKVVTPKRPLPYVSDEPHQRASPEMSTSVNRSRSHIAHCAPTTSTNLAGANDQALVRPLITARRIQTSSSKAPPTGPSRQVKSQPMGRADRGRRSGIAGMFVLGMDKASPASATGLASAPLAGSGALSAADVTHVGSRGAPRER